MVVDAGKLDRRIGLEQRTITRNEYGEPIEGWTLVIEVWAEKRELIGREAVIARSVEFVGDTQWRIRWRADVEPASWRIAHEGKVYPITSVAEIGRRDGLEIVTRRP